MTDTMPGAEPLPATGGAFIRQADGSLVQDEPPMVVRNPWDPVEEEPAAPAPRKGRASPAPASEPASPSPVTES